MSKNLSYTAIKPGVFFSYRDSVYECVEAVFSKKSRQQGSNTVRMKNVTTGAVITKTLHSSDSFNQVAVEKCSLVYVYSHRGVSWFHHTNTPATRLKVSTATIAGISFVPDKTTVTGIFSGETLLAIQVPIKTAVLVRDAPPSLRGNTTQGGSKQVVLETGAVVATPLFVRSGDTVQINTETGKYVGRV